MKHISLNAKVISIISILVISSLTIGYFGLSRIKLINEYLSEIADPLTKKSEISADLLDQQRRLTIFNKSYLLTRSPEKRAQIKGQIKEARDILDKRMKDLELLSAEKTKSLLNEFSSALTAWCDFNAKARDMADHGKEQEADSLSDGEGELLRTKATSILKELNAQTRKRISDMSQSAEDAYKTAVRLLVFISFASILGAGLMAAFVLRALSRNIDSVIVSLKENALQVSSAAHQVASSSEELSEASTEQAASLEETASALEEMSSMVKRNADNASSTTEMTSSTRTSAEKGKQVVEQMIAAISEINASNNAIMSQIEQSNRSIGEIVGVISEIGNKTKVINDIVFQTKLLSFNASVEAARAGEHGKGFAVVAEEVGNLAQMSGSSAQQITAMLESSIQKVEGIVNETKTKVDALVQTGREKVEQGTLIAQECGKVLDEIVGGVGSVNNKAAEISHACIEQSKGVEEINKAMVQLDQVTQTNAATSEEAASAAEELSAQAESLKSVVELLVLTVKGGESGTQPKPETRYSAESATRKEKPTAKMLPFKPRAKKKNEFATENASALKKAAGAESIPSTEDSRFKEV